MKWLLFIFLLSLHCHSARAQAQNNDSLWFHAFKNSAWNADAHAHTGYKKYFRLSTADMMKILSAYDTVTRSFNPKIVSDYNELNWKPYHRTAKALRTGNVATVKKYDQNSYAEIKYVPGSILINSFSPYEKQFALKGIKRSISHHIVSGVSMDRLKACGKGVYTPMEDFLAEYYFNLMQHEEKFITTSSPEFIYKQDGTAYHKNPVYYNKIRMMRDKKELDSVLLINDNEFRKWTSFIDTPHFITPMVMSVEGAQVLYDTLSGDPKNILNPLNIHIPGSRFYSGTKTLGEYAQIKEELLANVKKIKELPHRMFCIILAHFAQNHVVGFAKSLDRDVESISHRALATLTRITTIRNDMIRKTYAGFNPGCEPSLPTCKPDHFGLQVVEAFLDTANIYGKPTYIDVKHMDVKARIE